MLHFFRFNNKTLKKGTKIVTMLSKFGFKYVYEARKLISQRETALKGSTIIYIHVCYIHQEGSRTL